MMMGAFLMGGDVDESPCRDRRRSGGKGRGAARRGKHKV